MTITENEVHAVCQNAYERGYLCGRLGGDKSPPMSALRFDVTAESWRLGYKNGNAVRKRSVFTPSPETPTVVEVNK